MLTASSAGSARRSQQFLWRFLLFSPPLPFFFFSFFNGPPFEPIACLSPELWGSVFCKLLTAKISLWLFSYHLFFSTTFPDWERSCSSKTCSGVGKLKIGNFSFSGEMLVFWLWNFYTGSLKSTVGSWVMTCSSWCVQGMGEQDKVNVQNCSRWSISDLYVDICSCGRWKLVTQQWSCLVLCSHWSGKGQHNA